MALETALRRSEELVQAAEVPYYLVNASTLLAIAPPAASARTVRLVLHSPAVLTLVRRMRYLASVLPRGQRVVLKLSRLAEMVGSLAAPAHSAARWSSTRSPSRRALQIGQIGRARTRRSA